MGLKVKQQNKITHFSFIKVIKKYNDNFFLKIIYTYGYLAH